LFLLAAAGVLPLALLSGMGLYVLYRQQVAQVERTGVDLARALATAVDAELRRSFAALEVLSSATTLERGDLKGFDERARRVLESQSQWAAIILADPGGKPLTNTSYPMGAELPGIVEPASFHRAAVSRQAVVGALALGPRGQAMVPLRVPVMQGDRVRYVITAVLKPAAIFDIVSRQRVADEWIVSIFDAKNQRVARSRANE